MGILMEVHYSNLYAACPDWRAEKLILEHVERGENKVWTSSQVVVDAARCLRKEGKLDELTFVFHYDMEDLEKKLAIMSDRVAAMSITLDNFVSTQQLKTTGIKGHPSDFRGTPVTAIPKDRNPDYRLLETQSIQKFRDAMIAFNGEKYLPSINQSL